MGESSKWSPISLDDLLGIQSYTQKFQFYTISNRFNPQKPENADFMKIIKNLIFYVFWAPAEVGGTSRQALSMS